MLFKKWMIQYGKLALCSGCTLMLGFWMGRVPWTDMEALLGNLTFSEEENPQVVAALEDLALESTSQLESQMDNTLEPQVYEETLELSHNDSVYTTLRNLGLTPLLIQNLVKAASKYVDLGRVPRGFKLTLKRVGEDAEPVEIIFHLNVRENLHFEKNPHDSDWTVRKVTQDVLMETGVYEGVVKNSLWQSAYDAGLDGAAIAMLADVFAWQVDFERQIRPGDAWKVVIEKEVLENGKFYGWGHVIAAQFHGNAGNYDAYRFVSGNQSAGYYDLNGDNMKGKFLKSPLKYSRISSPFQRKRYHPILKVNRPHLGVDYAASAGTPVRTVGDGVISILGRRGGNGNMIKIRHNSKYQTAYKHLSGFARGLRSGSRVRQGQVIGYVGSTGLATGPHLHFEFYENGQYTDPLGVKFPKQDSILASDRGKFDQAVMRANQLLKGAALRS
ncbi:MAG: peptidoglycan DD-metalloendopeptidase family protein [Zetaproteobacteria bacterium]|nr:peptidoglycan DD-metalloendopeptidase family protein [Zetaproteobacteria bacterium]